LRDPRREQPTHAGREQEEDHARELDHQRGEDHSTPAERVGKRAGQQQRYEQRDRIDSEDFRQRDRREAPAGGVNGIERRRRRRREQEQRERDGDHPERGSAASGNRHLPPLEYHYRDDPLGLLLVVAEGRPDLAHEGEQAV